MGIEWYNDQDIDLIGPNLLQGFFGEGIPVPHANVGLNIHRIRSFVGNRLTQELGLLATVVENRGSTANAGVRGAALGGAAFGNNAGNEALEGSEERGETDNVGVGKEIVEKACDRRI